MGLTQFLPSEYYKYAVDFDGDGQADIWHSVPDALASAAKQLKDKGWQAGKPWAIEVRVPASVDCTIAEPSHVLPVAEWLKRGYVPAYGRKLTKTELAAEASLLLPEGTYGPAFLTPKNYYVIKEYNYSDLYVLFVGHLADLIGGGKPFEHPWSKNAQLHTKEVEIDAAAPHRARALQRQARRQGRHADARRARRLSEEERPEGRLLADRGGARPHAALATYRKYNRRKRYRRGHRSGRGEWNERLRQRARGLKRVSPDRITLRGPLRD